MAMTNNNDIVIANAKTKITPSNSLLVNAGHDPVNALPIIMMNAL
jgi:hypothetical protein